MKTTLAALILSMSLATPASAAAPSDVAGAIDDVTIDVEADAAGWPGQPAGGSHIRFNITYNTNISGTAPRGFIPSCGQVGGGDFARWSCNVDWPVDIVVNNIHYRYLINAAAIRFAYNPTTICFGDAAARLLLCLDGLKGAQTQKLPGLAAYKDGVTATLILQSPDGDPITVSNVSATARQGYGSTCSASAGMLRQVYRRNPRVIAALEDYDMVNYR